MCSTIARRRLRRPFSSTSGQATAERWPREHQILSPSRSPSTRTLACSHPKQSPVFSRTGVRRRASTLLPIVPSLVGIKAPSRLAPEPPRVHVLLQERTRPVLRIVEAVVEHVHDRE